MSMFKASSEIVSALQHMGAGKLRALHKSLDGSKFSGTLPHTVYFQMQKVFYQTKGKQCKKLNIT